MSDKKEMKAILIQGKKYVMVNERINFFRENFPNWTMESEILKVDGAVCIIKATIKDEKGVVVATGHAFEKADSSFINKTSYIENCETSAWGRALANLGIGIDASIASAEEVGNAVLNQKQPTVDEWLEKINNATAVNQLNAMWYQYREQFDKDSEDYKKINRAASDKKLELNNPDLKVEIRG